MLTNDEKKLIERLVTKLCYYNVKNKVSEDFYEGRFYTKDETLASTVGWASTVIEVINEKIKLEGFTGNDEFQFNTIFDENNLISEAPKVHREAQIFGTAYAVAGMGDPSIGEPEIIISMESPKSSIGDRNPRNRKLTNFMKIVVKGGLNGEDVGFLHLPNETIYFSLSMDSKNNFKEISRDKHNLGFVPAVMFTNQPRPSRPGGTSAITKSIRNNIINANDVGGDMRVAGKIYSTPQRYILNLAPGTFKTADGADQMAEAYMDRFWVLNGKEKGPEVKVGQFMSSSPTPFIEMRKAFALEVASESGINEEEFGYHGTQPAGADAIRVKKEREANKAKAVAEGFSPEWIALAKFCIILRDGKLTGNTSNLKPIWGSPYPATPAATADAIVKYISAGVIAPDSDYALRAAGMSESEIIEIRKQKAKNYSSTLLEAIKNGGQKAISENKVIEVTSITNSEE